jgi:hypothetical protein
VNSVTGFRQLPQGSDVFLDHHGHFVPDMDAASAALTRLGFRLTPYTEHSLTTDPNQPPRPSGTANRCIMLCEGYIEVLSAVGHAPMAEQLRDAVARYTGLHLLAFSTADAAAEHARLAALGFTLQPLVHLSRAFEGDHLRFSVIRLDPGQAMQEGRIQFLTHETPDLLWGKDLLDHPNRIIAMREVVLASADPDEAAARYARYLGRPATPVPGGWHIALARGGLTILSASALKAALPGIVIPTLPFIAASTLISQDIQATVAYLEAADITLTATAPGVFRAEVMPALGSTMIFMDRGGRIPWL